MHVLIHSHIRIHIHIHTHMHMQMYMHIHIHIQRDDIQTATNSFDFLGRGVRSGNPAVQEFPKMKSNEL